MEDVFTFIQDNLEEIENKIGEDLLEITRLGRGTSITRVSAETTSGWGIVFSNTNNNLVLHSDTPDDIRVIEIKSTNLYYTKFTM